MNLKCLAFGVCVTLLPGAAMSAGRMVNEVDLYYVRADSTIEVPPGSAEDKGDGVGVRGQFVLNDHLFIGGEYQRVGYDDADLNADQLRLGLGVSSAQDDALAVLFAQLEYIKADIANDSGNGYGLHAGMLLNAAKALQFKARIGFVDIDSRGAFGVIDGMEYSLGAAYAITRKVGVMVDYRIAKLRGRHGVEVDLDELRIGARYHF